MVQKHVEELIGRIRNLQEDLEAEYASARGRWNDRRIQLADEFIRQQRRYRIGLFRFLLRSRLLVVLTAPVIYAGWIPFLLLDAFVSLYGNHPAGTASQFASPTTPRPAAKIAPVRQKS